MVAAAVGIGVAAGGLGAAAMTSNAAKSASNAQSAAAQAGINQQNQQFAAVQKLLSPYVSAGTSALTRQQDLNGDNGASAQAAAIAALQSSPQYTSALAAGNNNILANASATGGLRGGNVQGALGQFAPSLLTQTINDQYSRLGSMSALGENAAAGTGNAALSTGNQISGLLQQQGAAQAGGALAGGAAGTGYVNALAGGLGAYAGLGGRFSTAPAVTNGSNASGYNGTLNNPSAYVAGGGF